MSQKTVTNPNKEALARIIAKHNIKSYNELCYIRSRSADRLLHSIIKQNRSKHPMPAGVIINVVIKES